MKTKSIASRTLQIAALGALSTFAIGLGTVTAHADETRSTIVRYGELDLNKQAGAEVLYKRIKAAASRLCGDEFSPLTTQSTRATDCYKDAVSNAVAKVNSPLLTAIHSGSTSERMASR